MLMILAGCAVFVVGFCIGIGTEKIRLARERGEILRRSREAHYSPVLSRIFLPTMYDFHIHCAAFGSDSAYSMCREQFLKASREVVREFGMGEGTDG